MTILAMNLAAHCNGVSKLHGEVSRGMWNDVWPGVMEEEVPITSITNGVHTRGWISQELGVLFDRYMGPSWGENPDDTKVWEKAYKIPNSELWRMHERYRERLVAFARKRGRWQLERRGAPDSEIAMAEQVLDPEVLTIGFARRFARYKRGTLLLSDIERLKRLLTDTKRPIQIIFAGKAHPADHLAKELIRDLVHFMRDPAVCRRIIFLEDYDMNVARYMVQGVDVWLNTPRRPLEASGTSGMKAAANGGLNLSVLDGWWVEGYSRNCGWSIGQGEEYEDLDLQDSIESNALYDLLEKEVVPLFYDRAADGLPHGWIDMMKGSIAELSGCFSANRMVDDYIRGPYMSAASEGMRLMADNLSGAKELAQWKAETRNKWNDVKLLDVEMPKNGVHTVGDKMPVQATIQLGDMKPEDILVQLYHGHLDSKGNIIEENASATTLELVGTKDGNSNYKGDIPCSDSGNMGFSLRVLPFHETMASPFDLKLIHWG